MGETETQYCTRVSAEGLKTLSKFFFFLDKEMLSKLPRPTSSSSRPPGSQQLASLIMPRGEEVRNLSTDFSTPCSIYGYAACGSVARPEHGTARWSLGPGWHGPGDQAVPGPPHRHTARPGHDPMYRGSPVAAR
jgi:hypothetical protein